MRKRKISSPEGLPDDQFWLDLERLARVELTSEDAEHPIESALIPGNGGGWRASDPGEQKIRLVFDEPQTLKLIHLSFGEALRERTQEFVLSWSPDGGRSFHEIVRQQYNFSPLGRTQELEDFHVDLHGVTVLELRIVPDISGGPECAALEQLRLG